MTAQPPGDDDLRAMLEARADRVAPGAARDVLAAVRAEVRGPGDVAREGVTFGIRPLDAVRRSGVRWRLAALGVAAVIAVAVLGSRLDLGGPGPADGGASPTGTLARVQSVAPGASLAPGGSAAPGVAFEDLGRALDSGELDGRVVIVTGRLQLLIGRCLAGGTGDCTWLRLEGLDDTAIDKGSLSVEDATAAIAAHPVAAPIALRVMDRSVAFLGWVADGVPAPLDVAGLARSAGVGPVDLAVVDGWVIGASQVAPSCPFPGTRSACPGSWPRLASSAPAPDGAILYGASGLDVIVEPAVGLGPAPDAISGPFLVGGAEISAAGGRPAYRVVDRLDPATTVWVGTGTPVAAESRPPATPGTPTDGLSVDQLLAALADGSLDGRVLTVQGTLAMTGDCGYGTSLCTRFNLEGLDGVPVTWEGPLTPPDQRANELPAITVSGRLVLVPRGGGLVLLGKLKGDLGRPQTVGDLIYQRRLLSFDPFVAQAVTGWLVRPQGGVCPSDGPQPGQCGATQVFLTDHAPAGWSVAAGAARMDVAAGAGPGLAGDTTVLDGSFLGRYAFEGACTRTQADVLDCSTLHWTWTIVARYDPADVLTLVTP